MGRTSGNLLTANARVLGPEDHLSLAPPPLSFLALREAASCSLLRK